MRSILDVRDSANAYWLAAQHCEVGDVYNIGGSTTISVGDFLRKLMEVTGTKIELYEDPSLLRPSDVVLQIPNSDKFRRQTGWSEQHSLESSISFLISEAEKIY